MASPHWKTGLRSKYVGVRGEAYHQALADPHLSDLREDQATAEVVIRQLLEGSAGRKLSKSVRKELAELMELRQKLISAEARRIRDLATAVPIERVRAMGAALVAANREVLFRASKAGELGDTEPERLLSEIQQVWLRLMGMQAGGRQLAVVEDDGN